jgi:hypothetical protein
MPDVFAVPACVGILITCFALVGCSIHLWSPECHQVSSV